MWVGLEEGKPAHRRAGVEGGSSGHAGRSFDRRCRSLLGTLPRAHYLVNTEVPS